MWTDAKFCLHLFCILCWWSETGKVLKATSVCTRSAAEVLWVHPNQRSRHQRSLRETRVILQILPHPLTFAFLVSHRNVYSSCHPLFIDLLTGLSCGGSQITPSDAHLQTETLNISYSFVGCVPGCLPSMVERDNTKTKWCICHCSW